MKKLLICCLVLLISGAVVAVAQTGTPKPKSTLSSEINSNFPNNTAGAITPQILRQTTQDLLASWQQAQVNFQSGTTYTVAATDQGNLLIFNAGSAVAVTIPAASTTGFQAFTFIAQAVNSTVTLTPQSGTIAGGASLSLSSGQSAQIVSDGTNYQVVKTFGGTPSSSLAVGSTAVTGGNSSCLGVISGILTNINCARALSVTSFGAVCDGVTDDHVAIQAAIAAGIAQGKPVELFGFCAIATGLTINGTVYLSSPTGGGFICSAGITCITIDTDSPVYLHDMTIAYGSTSGSDTAIIVTSTAGGHTANTSSYFWRLIVESSFNGINFANAQTWVLRDSSISVAGGDGLIVANTFNGDDGDATAYANIIGSSVTGGNAVHWKSAGGFRFVNNKIIGTGFNVGFLIDEATGLATSDLFVNNNSIEGLATLAAACIKLQRNGNTATLFNVSIIDNECAGPDVGVFEVLDGTGQWITGLTIGDNMMGLSANATVYGYRLLTPVSGLSIHHGVIQGNGGTNTAVVVTTQTTANCAVGPIAKTGTFTTSTLSSCTSYTPN